MRHLTYRDFFDPLRASAPRAGLALVGAALSASMLLSAPAARADEAYYEAQDPGALDALIAPFLERDGAQRAAILKDTFKKKRLKRVEWSTAGKPAEALWPDADGALAALDLSTAFRVWHVLQYGRRGLEADLWSVPGHGPLRPLSIEWSKANALHIRVGDTKKEGRYGTAKVNAADLSKRFDINITTEGAEWGPNELRALALAMEELTPADRSFLKGVPIVRVPAPKKKKASRRETFQAKYVPRPEGPVVEVYDAFVHGDTHTFNGPLTAPLPISVGVLVHEVGHAIARGQLIAARSANRARKTHDAALRVSFTEGKARLDEMNAKLKKGEANRDDVVAVAGELKAINAAIKKNQGDANAAKKAIAKANKKGCPAEMAFTKVRPVRKAVTDYGKTSAGESFAEAFKLARCDADALKRIAPKAEAFFASGAYVEHARTRIGPPPVEAD